MPFESSDKHEEAAHQTGMKSDSRFIVAPVDEASRGIGGDNEDCVYLPTTSGLLDEDEAFDLDFPFRERSLSCATQSQLSRLGMLTATADAGSLLGSSVLLSSPSYLNICNEVSKSQVMETVEATSMEYLDTIMENAEYIDTVKGKLPLTEAAKMIAKDKSQHEQLFNPYYIRKVRIECYKKLVCIGFSFLCLFGSFFALRNLQTSMSRESDDPIIGLITFGCLRLLMWFGGLLASSLVARIRAKWTLVIAAVLFLLYPIANFYPTAYTLIPCALMAGIGVGMIWNAEGVYMINLAAKYALVSNGKLLGIIGKFNGVVFTLYQGSHLLGNLLSSLILSDKIKWFPNSSNNFGLTEADISNSNDSINSHVFASFPNDTVNFPMKFPVNHCGIDFYTYGLALNTTLNTNVAKVDPRQYYLLFGILTALGCIGFLILCFGLKPLKTLKTPGNANMLTNLKQFFMMFGNPRILLLLLLMLYIGFSGSVLMADYTKAYITCAYGISYIGYVLIAGALFAILGAFISGRVVYKTGRIPIFLIAIIASSGSLVMILVWKPTIGTIEPLAFVPVCLWSFGDGILMSQTNGFLGEMFRTELMFGLSTFHLCLGLGQVLAALTSAFNWLSLSGKVYLLITNAWVGFGLFLCLELLRRRKRL